MKGNALKLCLLCLFSNESKLIILVIVAKTKNLHVVNLQVYYHHEKAKYIEQYEKLKINLIIYYEARPHLSIIGMNCSLNEV